MKAVSIKEAEGQLDKLIKEAYQGEIVVLTDGDKKVTLLPAELNLDEDSPELEAELLKAANGPFSPYREGELREIADRALREHRAKQKQ
jgi:antitoxin (DNA-binding transcriptional repressor) of toxin-antitoxin stability system